MKIGYCQICGSSTGCQKSVAATWTSYKLASEIYNWVLEGDTDDSDHCFPRTKPRDEKDLGVDLDRSTYNHDYVCRVWMDPRWKLQGFLENYE